MANFYVEFSNSKKAKNKGNVKSQDHHDYIQRKEKYSPQNNEKQLAVEHRNYVQREELFSHNDNYEDLLFSFDGNMPDWCKDDTKVFWISSDKFERKNGRTYEEILISLPTELSDEDNINLTKNFCEQLFGKNFVYSYGIHSKPSSTEGIQNIHAHIMYSSRKLDNINRTPEQFFKRYNPKFPERGGCQKDRKWNDINLFSNIRKQWGKLLNEELEKKGFEKVSIESLEKQMKQAIKDEDFLKVAMLDRPKVNCSGSIIMKVSKYGIESLTKKEASEYELYLIAKELKQVNEKIYKKEKTRREEYSFLDFNVSTKKNLESIYLDISKYSYFNEQKQNELFNNYEKKFREHFENDFLGEAFYNKNYNTVEKYVNVINSIKNLVDNNNETIQFNKKYDKDFHSLKRNDLSYDFLIENVSADIIYSIKEKQNIVEEDLKYYKENIKTIIEDIQNKYEKNIFNFIAMNNTLTVENNEKLIKHFNNLKELEKIEETYDILKNRKGFFNKIKNNEYIKKIQTLKDKINNFKENDLNEIKNTDDFTKSKILFFNSIKNNKEYKKDNEKIRSYINYYKNLESEKRILDLTYNNLKDYIEEKSNRIERYVDEQMFEFNWRSKGANAREIKMQENNYADSTPKQTNNLEKYSTINNKTEILIEKIKEVTVLSYEIDKAIRLKDDAMDVLGEPSRIIKIAQAKNINTSSVQSLYRQLYSDKNIEIEAKNNILNNNLKYLKDNAKENSSIIIECINELKDQIDAKEKFAQAQIHKENKESKDKGYELLKEVNAKRKIFKEILKYIPEEKIKNEKNIKDNNVNNEKVLSNNNKENTNNENFKPHIDTKNTNSNDDTNVFFKRVNRKEKRRKGLLDKEYDDYYY